MSGHTGGVAVGEVAFVDLHRMHESIQKDLDDAYHRVVDASAFTLGREVESFEQAFASYVGTRHAIGVASGTDALHLALRARGIGPGDEVITAVNTFAATAEAIMMAGARPIFADIDEHYLIDVDHAASLVTPRTRAIIPVHLYGQPADMLAVDELAARYGLFVLEDACQAHGSSRDGRRAGASGDAAAFSFYPGKNLGALGDGGMVTTNDDELAARIRLLRAHGENAERLHVEPGFCSRLHGLQAAFLSAKLPHLDSWNAMRAAAAERYHEGLAGSSVVPPTVAPGASHVYHLYVLQVVDRDAFRAALGARGIQTAIHYAWPLHVEPAFAFLGYSRGEFPKAEAAAARIVSLPMYPYLLFDEVDRVIEAVREVDDA
jgi:dTDP-4-amino-4,6-dideoxygalactose transaminase